jgi:ABC-type spermidine/putrescine transport system permease subunit I
MKLVATILVAAFVVVASMSFAFAECAGHTKAQMVKNQTQEQMSSTQSTPTASQFAVAEKADAPAKTVVTPKEKK